MSKVKIFSMLNADERPNLDEVNNEPSMTVPEQAMDLREILIRFASGQDIPVGHDLPYHDDDEIDTISGRHIDTLDLVDKAELKKVNLERIKAIKEPLEDKPPFVPDEPVKEVKNDD